MLQMSTANVANSRLLHNSAMTKRGNKRSAQEQSDDMIERKRAWLAKYAPSPQLNTSTLSGVDRKTVIVDGRLHSVPKSDTERLVANLDASLTHRPPTDANGRLLPSVSDASVVTVGSKKTIEDNPCTLLFCVDPTGAVVVDFSKPHDSLEDVATPDLVTLMDADNIAYSTPLVRSLSDCPPTPFISNIPPATPSDLVAACRAYEAHGVQAIFTSPSLRLHWSHWLPVIPLMFRRRNELLILQTTTVASPAKYGRIQTIPSATLRTTLSKKTGVVGFDDLRIDLQTALPSDWIPSDLLGIYEHAVRYGSEPVLMLLRALHYGEEKIEALELYLSVMTESTISGAMRGSVGHSCWTQSSVTPSVSNASVLSPSSSSPSASSSSSPSASSLPLPLAPLAAASAADITSSSSSSIAATLPTAATRPLHPLVARVRLQQQHNKK